MSNHKPGTTTTNQYNTDAIPEGDVTQQDLYDSRTNPEAWLMAGGSYENQRHTTADTITTDNVSNLSMEWSYQTSTPEDTFSGSPIVVPGDPPIMYQTNSVHFLKAVNARTGEILWDHHYEPASNITSPPADRGVGVYGDTIYRHTLDLGIIAINRYTGEERWYFNGADLYRGEAATDSWTHPELTFPRRTGGSSAYPVVVYEGNLLHGSFGGEYGAAGSVSSVDLNGNLKWKQSTVPSHRWAGDTWKHGGGTTWTVAAVDPETDNAIWGTSNPGPWYGTVRPGPNEYTAGKVSFDATNGDYQWHLQDAPHDYWDYDSNSPPFVYTATVNGEETRLASWTAKTGWMFTVDIETGKLVNRSPPLVDHVNLFDLPDQNIDDSPWNAPYLWGGTNWQPPAYDPVTQTAIVKLHNRPMKLAWQEVEYEVGEGYSGVAGIQFAVPGDDIPGWNGRLGGHAGVDPVTGEIKWRNWEDNIQWGGILTTATGVTFTGITPDTFVALDTETGQELWRDDVGIGIAGSPISWYDPGEGKQYITVQASGHRGTGADGNHVLTYSLSD